MLIVIRCLQLEVNLTLAGGQLILPGPGSSQHLSVCLDLHVGQQLSVTLRNSQQLSTVRYILKWATCPRWQSIYGRLGYLTPPGSVVAGGVTPGGEEGGVRRPAGDKQNYPSHPYLRILTLTPVPSWNILREKENLEPNSPKMILLNHFHYSRKRWRKSLMK